MDPIQQNPIPAPIQAQPKRSLGPIISIVVIVILLIAGSLYVWGSKVSTSDSAAGITESQRMVAPQEPAPVSASDDIDSLDADLQTDSGTEIDFSSIDETL